MLCVESFDVSAGKLIRLGVLVCMSLTFFVGVDPVDCRIGVVEAKTLSTLISKI
jgi:hypothetical protein